MEDCKVFVGGLSYSTDEKSLADFFESYLDDGTSTKKIINLVIVRDHTTPERKSRGFGFVTFFSRELAVKALDLDCEELDGRRIGVREAVDRRKK